MLTHTDQPEKLAVSFSSPRGTSLFRDSSGERTRRNNWNDLNRAERLKVLSDLTELRFLVLTSSRHRIYVPQRKA
jgi:hypothetical protein